jgi:glycosyltransferase involved in cell wall biosynthesis
MRSKLERLARTLGIGDQVRFLGRRPPEEVADWMNRADVLCLPSRSEGMPNVVLEARACGLPVVASPAGAIPELPLDKTHFLVVPACTPAHLAAGLHDMLSRDLSKRIPDPNIPTWKTMAERILAKIERGV